MNFPVDDSRKTCVYDRPDYKLMYFSDPNNLDSGKSCVKTCPNQGEVLACDNNDAEAKAACSAIGAGGYDTEAAINRLGAFCLPKDERLTEKIWNSP